MIEKRARALTPADMEDLKELTCKCPYGMSQHDVFRLRDFLDFWEKAKSSVGGYVIKVFIVLVIAIGVLVTWITNK